MGRSELKKDWAPTEVVFRRFLNWLDEGIDSAGERYLEMRRRLELYFERRGCRAPDELADETLNRVARRLDEEGSIATPSPAHYCYTVARLVFHEYFRKSSGPKVIDADEIPAAAEDHGDQAERLLTRLEQCLETLAAGDRDLILEYYRGEQRAKIERRRQLAARFRLSMNALCIRACRLREKLEACVRSALP